MLEAIGARSEADRVLGRREGTLGRASSLTENSLSQPHRRHPHLFRRNRIPGCVHRCLPQLNHRRVGGTDKEQVNPLLRKLLAGQRSGQPRPDAAVEHRRPAFRQLLPLKRYHHLQVATLATVHRPAGTGQRVDQEDGTVKKNKRHQTIRRQFPQNIIKRHPVRTTSTAGERGRGT